MGITITALIGVYCRGLNHIILVVPYYMVLNRFHFHSVLGCRVHHLHIDSLPFLVLHLTLLPLNPKP